MRILMGSRLGVYLFVMQKKVRREKELEEKENETFLFKASSFRDVKQPKRNS